MLWLATLLTGATARNHSRGWPAHIAGALSRAATMLSRYRVRRAATRELNRLSDHMLHDIGMTRADIARVVSDMIATGAAAGRGAPAARPDRSRQRTMDGCCAGA